MFVTVQRIQRMDEIAIHQVGIPSLVLMENAGRQVAQEVIRRLRRKSRPLVCVVCGLGNNAGDGLVTARHLWEAGMRVQTYLVGEDRQLKNDARVNYTILQNLRYPLYPIRTVNAALKKHLSGADLVVDAIFGVGLNREIQDPFKTLIQTINATAGKRRILSVDIPSGLDGTTGKTYGVCVKAHTTVTFTFAKKGFCQPEARPYVGKVKVVDIGIPAKIKKGFRRGKMDLGS